MNYPNKKDSAFIRAKSRVEKLKAFYTHLSVYIVVNVVISAFRIIINLRNGGSFEDVFNGFSFYASWLLWGIGLAIHAFTVFVLPLLIGHNWEEKKIKKFIEEEERNHLN